jgi:hypothetical protein
VRWLLGDSLVPEQMGNVKGQQIFSMPNAICAESSH